MKLVHKAILTVGLAIPAIGSAGRCRRLALAEYDVRTLEVRNRDRDLSGLAEDHGTPRKLVGRAL